MRNLPINSHDLRALATGGVQPVAVWAELPDGSRRVVPDAQEKDGKGCPLWTVEAMVPAQSDRDRAEIISVRVASYDRPEVAEFAPVAFEGLVCSVSVNKRTGQLGQYWGATRVLDTRPVKAAA